MARLVLFGPGYTGRRIMAACAARGWAVHAFGRAADVGEVAAALERATHLVSTAPPVPGTGDPVLGAYASLIGRVPWVGYLSSTGVYGDAQGAWVDEAAPLAGRRPERIAADRAWLAIGARVFRLPGIYGPGRSMFDRLGQGRAHRVGLAGQVFSRVHVDDIVAGVLAAIDRGPAGAYNLADDLPAPQDAVVEEACRLAGIAPPPFVRLDALGPAARAFYAENRRVAAGKAHRLLGWLPRFPTYREGLRALIATTSPTTTSAPPAAASTDQR